MVYLITSSSEDSSKPHSLRAVKVYIAQSMLSAFTHTSVIYRNILIAIINRFVSLCKVCDPVIASEMY